MIKILGFAPDLDPTTAGVLLDCDHLIPSERGFQAANTFSPIAGAALPAAATGGAVLSTLDASKRIYAGTSTNLYQLSAGAWVDRSRAGNYTGAKWRFDQFGDISLAASGSSPLQFSSGTAFADIAGSPIASLLCVSNGFVMAFNGPTIGRDGWACSGLYNYTQWTPSLATQSATGRLFDTSGPIVGARTLGDLVIVYKERSLYVGQYSGPPVIWSFQQVAGGDIGAVSNESIVDIGFGHAFVGADDFYIFDGTRPQAIGAPVRRWFFDEMDANHKDKIVGMFDRYNGRVYWYFSANGSAGQLNRCIVYNVRTQQWGRDDNVVQSAMLYADPGITWGQLWDNLGQSYNNWPQTPYGDIFPPSGTPIPAVFNASNQLCLLTGPPAQSSLLTGDFGDDYAASLMSGCTLRFLLRPTTVTAQGYCKPEEGSNVQTGRTGVYHNGRIDIMQSARWHRLAINFVGPHELAQFGPMLKADGVR